MHGSQEKTHEQFLNKKKKSPSFAWVFQKYTHVVRWSDDTTLCWSVEERQFGVYPFKITSLVRALKTNPGVEQGSQQKDAGIADTGV